MTEQQRFPWLAILLGIGCVGILCICILIIGGGAVFWLVQGETGGGRPL